MLTQQLQSAQEQYDQKLDELKEKARDKKRSEIEQNIVRYEVLLAQTQKSKEELSEQIKQMKEETGKLGQSTVGQSKCCWQKSGTWKPCKRN